MWKRGMCVATLCGAMASGVLADQMELTGVARDFKRGDLTGGHPDFETAGAMGRFGHVINMVTMNLSDDRKPVYNPTRPYKDTMQSAASFDQWFRDVPDVNQSMPLTLTLDNGKTTKGGVYTFHDSTFWPIDGKMFGDEGLGKNFHFTFELHTEFTYRPGQHFTFIGDDDVWVYVNGLRVIDLGGVHTAVTGSVLLFDGKAFVEKAHFPLSSTVLSVGSTMAASLAQKWTNLGLPGTCPVVQGSRYIDLGLLPEGGAESRAEFMGASVKVWSTKNLANVVVQFEDGSEQTYSNLSQGTSGTFSGTNAYLGKLISGVWVKPADNTSGKGQWISAETVDGANCNLDFFFAERHTTQSNFRIDTSMVLTSKPLATVSPAYD